MLSISGSALLRPRMRVLAFLLVVGACAGVRGARDPQALARAQAEPDSGCAWSAPRELRAGGARPVYVEYPSAAPVDGGTMLLGSPSIVWAQPTRVAPVGSTHRDSLFPAGVVLQPSGDVRQVGDPAGSEATSASPRVAALDDGTALVVWGKRLVEDGRVETPVRGLWAARYDGHRWIAPHEIFADSAIDWDPFTATSELVGARDTFSLVFRTMRPERFVLLRYERGVWRTRVLPFHGSYPRVLATPQTLLLAYFGSGATTMNSLLVRGSSDGGATWTEPRVIESSARISYQDAVLRQLGDRAVIVWRTSAWTRYLDSVMVAEAPAAAAVDSPWVRGPTLHVPSLHVGLSAAVAGSPTGPLLHVAFEGERTIGVATWSRGRWSTVRLDAFPEAATPPTIVRLSDRMAMMWGAARDTPAGPEPVTLVATHAIGCTPR